MNKVSNVIIFSALIFICASCKDLVEQDISHNILVVNSPTDNYVASNFNVTFWWNSVKDAKKYRLQIASPSFDTLQTLVCDTLIDGDRINFILLPGRYQWRIRGENGSSYTPYVIRNLFVDTNSNLNGHTFYVNAPADQFYSNKTTVFFSWNEYPSSDKYEFALLDANNVPLKFKTTTSTYLLDTIVEGYYYWQVRAINSSNSSSTAFSGQRKLVIDMTPPLPATFSAPTDQALVPNPISLSWQQSADVLGDSILVASDSLFQNMVYRYYIKNALSLVLPALTVSNTYYWKVKTEDSAQNWGTQASYYRFTVTF